MIPETTLAFGGGMHAEVRAHLFPGDGLEAAAILVCSRVPGPRRRFLVRDWVSVPYAECKRRERDSLTWAGQYIEDAIDLAEPLGSSVILIHSHPGGLFGFSRADHESDLAVIPGILQAHGDVHGSAVMTPDGAVCARLYNEELAVEQVDLVTVAGDDLSYWWAKESTSQQANGRPLAFTSAMSAELARLSALVVGASGTGSIAGEQLARLGLGRVVAVDFDRIETRNLNRVINSTLLDARGGCLKVDSFAAAVLGHRGAGVAIPIAKSIATRDAVIAAAQCDIIFCCVDSLEARLIADLIAAAFLLPLFDVGVVIATRNALKDGGVAIADVCGRVDYVQPGGATLSDRGIYTPESLRGEYLRLAAPQAHQQELDAGYLRGVLEQAPDVITLNMRAASACINEFIARAYPFRHESNSLYARTLFSLAACDEEYFSEGDFVASPNAMLGRGDQEPLLGLPALKAPRHGSS